MNFSLNAVLLCHILAHSVTLSPCFNVLFIKHTAGCTFGERKKNVCFILFSSHAMIYCVF